MLKILAITLCLFAITGVADLAVEHQALDAQRRQKNNSGGQNARKRPARNRRIEKREDREAEKEKKRAETEKQREDWRKERETPDGSSKKDGAAKETTPEWWMQRASTWMSAADQDMPILLAFISEDQSADAKFWVDKESAALSRSSVIFVMCIDGQEQVTAAEKSAKPERKRKNERRDEGENADDDSEDAADSESAKGPSYVKTDSLDEEWSEEDKKLQDACKESSFAPASGLWYANLREAYEVEENNTFLLVDPFGNVIKSYSAKPSAAKLEREIESHVKAAAKIEDQLGELIDDALKAEEEGKRKDLLEALSAIFELKLAGNPFTMTAAEIYFDLLADANKELEAARTNQDKDAIKALQRAFAGTDFDKNFEEAKGDEKPDESEKKD